MSGVPQFRCLAPSGGTSGGGDGSGGDGWGSGKRQVGGRSSWFRGPDPILGYSYGSLWCSALGKGTHTPGAPSSS